MRWLVWLWMGLWSAQALAHPMSRDKWSLRTAVQLAGDKLDALVVLEVPFDVVSADLKAGLDEARASENPARSAQQVLDGYAKKHWDQLAAGLTLTVNGAPVEGAWTPRNNRMNGKGAANGGFFMYIVEFVPQTPFVWDTAVDIGVKNTGYSEPPMVYSAMVVAGEGWRVEKNSTVDLLPKRPYDLNAKDFWIADPALREVSVRYAPEPAGVPAP